ncbi:MAG: M12 family metallopeptidase [Cyclobacteriaceae bacterium]
MKRLNIFFILIIFIAAFSCQQEEAVAPAIEALSPEVSDVEVAFPGQMGNTESIHLGESNLVIEEIDGQFVLAGDILLTKEQVEMLKSKKGSNARTAISSLSKRWPNCTVYYAISSSLPNQSRVTGAIAHWEQEHPWITFVQRTTQTNYVEFVPSTGCSSYLGMIGGRQPINLASGCSTGNTIHEIGHALGLMHEQQRADRDNWITINWNNIENGKEFAFETYIQRGIGGFEIGQFDFNSIMLYSSYAFSDNGLPTITKLDGSTFVGQRNGLSAGDLEITEQMYDCEPQFGAYIFGPRFASNNSSYTWTSSVSNGIPPYTYVWQQSFDNGQTYPHTIGNGSSMTNYMPQTEDLYLRLTVTDSNGETGTGYWVTINTGDDPFTRP